MSVADSPEPASVPVPIASPGRAGAGPFLTITLVPFTKYPANPPGVAPGSVAVPTP
jgi:hypothetical protein